jgi:hypothetical protein
MAHTLLYQNQEGCMAGKELESSRVISGIQGPFRALAKVARTNDAGKQKVKTTDHSPFSMHSRSAKLPLPPPPGVDIPLPQLSVCSRDRGWYEECSHGGSEIT